MKKPLLLSLFLWVGAHAQSLEIPEFDAKIRATSAKQLIDLRPLEEFNRGHIKKAVNVDFNSEDFDALMLGNFDKSLPVLLYDFSGGKSQMAVAFIRKLGFRQVYDLKGGFAAWTLASKPYASSHTTTEPIAALTMNSFEKTLRESPFVLIDFYADWCQPCKKMDPLLNKIAQEKGKKLKLVKVNTDSNDSMVNIFKIEAVPTYVLFKNGKQVWRSEGEIPEGELREILLANKL